VSQPVPHTQRAPPRGCRRPNAHAITAKLAPAFEAGYSVYHAFYLALDAATRPPRCPPGTGSPAPTCTRSARPPTATRRASAIPSLIAHAPMQVWSWDITKLKGPYRGVTYELYVAIDVFSRMIVAWRLEEHEDDALARDMFETAFARHGARPQVVHSDGGSAMTSNTLTELFRELGVEISRNRPRVSNDNPYSESAFKTTKSMPTYPASSPASSRPPLGPPVRRLVQPRALPLRQRGPHPGHRPRRIMGGRAPRRVQTMTRLHASTPNGSPARPSSTPQWPKSPSPRNQ